MSRVSLYIMGTQADVDSSFSLRMNRVISDVSRIDTGTADYSFSFGLPSTPLNDRLFGFANALPVQGKFMRRYEASVEAEGVTVFSGTLTLTEYDAASRQYTANLVSVKVNTVEDIFGDMTLHDLDWRIPYEGADTINDLNADDGKVFFPLVAYGVFEKDPVYSDEVADDYTDRLILDDTVRFYHETFCPSLNLVELVRRLFLQKGYTLTGDILDDAVLNKIYTSVSLAQSQQLDYNYGEPKIGSVDLSVTWSNRDGSSKLHDCLTQELEYPYCHVLPDLHAGGNGTEVMQYEYVDVYNMLADGGTVTENIDSYLFDEGERCIVIPADGCYRFELEVTAELDTTWNQNGLSVVRKVWDVSSVPTVGETNFSPALDISEICPIEVHLSRNVLNDSGTVELIKGKNNRDWRNAPTVTEDYETCYPHEQQWQSRNPTDVQSPYNQGNWNLGSQRNPNTATRQYGYMPSAGSVFAYDPWVSENFICGFSTYLGPTVAVQKNGRSWYPGKVDHTNSLYNSAGYSFKRGNNNSQVYEPTPRNANAYPGADDCSVSISGNTLTGKVVCAVWLKRNDILTLNCVHRHWEPQSTTTDYKARYATNVTARLKMNSFTPRDYSYVLSEGLGYSTPTEFDTDLQLGNFLSNERTAADFVNDFLKSFNLQYSQTGTTVDISRGKVDVSSDGKAVVDIDGRCSWRRASWARADYPREYGVKWAAEMESWGYWLTVPADRRNDYNWKDYGDPGYDLVKVDPDSTSSNVVSVQNAMTWYDTFTLDREGQYLPLDLPVIGDYEVLAPGADYAEAMKKDCLDKRMRLWFRTEQEPAGEVTIQNTAELVGIYLPAGETDGVRLDYKDSPGSLLRRYFNTSMDIRSDVVSVGVRLTAREFSLLSAGALVKFDRSLYRLLEISGYDPSGENEATLTLTRV